MRCEHCNLPLTHRPRYTQVTGWAKEREAGGLNALKMKRSTGKVWCNSCGDHVWFTGKLPSLLPEGQLTVDDAA